MGEYRPTPETLALVKDVGGYPPREMSIVLAAHGSFRMTNIPDWWRTSLGEPAGGFDSISGTWEVVPHQGWYALQLNSSGQRQASLIGNQPPYAISLNIGDPDSGRAMVFIRKNRSN